MVTSLESRIWIRPRPPPIKLQCSQHKQKEAILERELQMKQNTTKVERQLHFTIIYFEEWNPWQLTGHLMFREDISSKVGN